MRQYIIGLDIGGTFTDAALLDSELGRGHIAKCLTTPDDPSRGAIQAIDMLLDAAGIDFSKVGSVSHATTLVSNALVERKGAPTGLLTTEGFRDTLHLKRELRYDSYDLNAEFPEPLVPRELTTEVPERVLADGNDLGGDRPKGCRGQHSAPRRFGNKKPGGLLPTFLSKR